MDDLRFDALTRSLIRGSTRRHLTRLAGGLTLAGVPMLTGDPQMSAKRKKKKKKPQPPAGGCSSGCAGGQVCRAGSCECPAAAPHWCPTENICVPLCPTGMVFTTDSCRCECAVTQSCCECRGGGAPFCRNNISDGVDCANSCTQGGVPFLAAVASAGKYGACDGSNRCEVLCAPVSFNADACQGNPSFCLGDLKPFRPLGGGLARCGRPTVTGSCGCTSHQQCADNHGIGAFCVQITGGACVCNGESTFCATQA